MNSSQNDFAYIAGLLDGEGCVMVKQDKKGWSRASVEVCMTNPAPLMWAVGRFGVGRFYVCRKDNRETKRRQAYKWIISKVEDAANLLRMCVNFMHVKKGESLAFICLSSIRKIEKVQGKRAHPKAEEKISKIVEILKRNGGEPNKLAYQEALDLCCYIRAAIFERDGE